MSKVRLDKLLSNLGYGSRKDVAGAIKRGIFRVGEKVYKDPSFAIDTKELANATYLHEPLDPLTPLTILLNKPRGYTCSHDEQGLLIYDLLPPRFQHRTPALSSAGRLDKESTGLVLMTDDGQLLHKVISPKLHANKHYRVTLRDELTGAEATQFFSGTFCLSGDLKPIKPALWVADGPKSGVMVLQEGRYHQIRRMFETIDNHVETLHRFKLGNLEMGDMQEGEYRVLNESDVQTIFLETPNEQL